MTHRIHMRLLLPFTLLIPLAAYAQEVTPPSLAARLTEVLQRESNGHSPSPDDIATFDPITPLPDAAALTAAVPLLLKALDSSDAPVRTLALTAIGGLQTLPTPLDSTASPAAGTPASNAPAPPPTPASFKPEIAHALAPAIPKIAAHLADELPANCIQAAIDLGGFTPDPPAALYPPLLAFLKRDDAIGTVGQAVVSDLLQIGPISDTTAAAVSAFLRRSDQTASSRSDLVDAIASKPNQSQSLNKTLLAYLSSDDPSLRARIILSLPQLDLAPDVFADTKALVAQLASLDPTSGQDNLQVINAAKSVTTCWTATKMATGCPTY